MPPVKKKSATKQLKFDTEKTEEEKYRKKIEEVEALRNHLAVKKDLAQRSQQACEEWKDRMKRAESTLEESKVSHRIVSADLSRQYKTMQTDLSFKIQELQHQLDLNKSKLDWTEQELKKTIDEKNSIKREKDAKIDVLNSKLTSVVAQYESFFNNYMDSLMSRMMSSKMEWQNKASKLKIVDDQLLHELGLEDFNN